MKAVSGFQVSSTAVDLDKEFETLLGALDLDIEDRNSQTLSWAGQLNTLSQNPSFSPTSRFSWGVH